ncbi:arginase [Heyndrickxia coagulans]|uniref:arginase n=1 Tax=Heyndrickxia coagulans TaxID=1398 RepID=UPI000CE2A8F7|nr:arginase [Heyndrickxia coagulans]AVD54838.1 arginase [Heyndrickxia coagulans]MDT9754772.1 arginase [Heyndrickxia coagulans]
MEKHIAIMGVPMDLGQRYKGVDLGPQAIRYAGVKEGLEKLGCAVTDLGNIEIGRAEQLPDDEANARNLKTIAKASQFIAEHTDEIVKSNRFPLIFGGDHSIAIGTIAGISKHYRNLGVIWFDAHADMNIPETSPSGNVHGMPLAASLGYGHASLTGVYGYIPKLKAEHVVLIGQRDLDEGEKDFIRNLGIKIYTMAEIDRIGMESVMAASINYLKERTDGIHLSLDLDALDPQEAPGVGTPVYGGLHFRESRLAMEILHDANAVVSADVVEVNPILDSRNQTAEKAVRLIETLFGKKLL